MNSILNQSTSNITDRISYELRDTQLVTFFGKS